MCIRDRAVYWHKKGADLGDRYSMFYLGMACIMGLGIKKDIKNGEDWFLKAGKEGVGSAYYLLAYLQALPEKPGKEKVIYQYLEKAGQEDNREFKWVLEDFRVRPENFEIIMEALAEKMKEGPGKEKLIKLLKGLTGNYLVD